MRSWLRKRLGLDHQRTPSLESALAGKLYRAFALHALVSDGEFGDVEEQLDGCRDLVDVLAARATVPGRTVSVEFPSGDGDRGR